MVPNVMGRNSLWDIVVTSYYHHSTTKETPFTMVYGANIMFLIEIETPLLQHSQFKQEADEAGL